MKVTYDTLKNERNIRERGLDFDMARELDFSTAAAGDVFRNGDGANRRLGTLKIDCTS